MALRLIVTPGVPRPPIKTVCCARAICALSTVMNTAKYRTSRGARLRIRRRSRTRRRVGLLSGLRNGSKIAFMGPSRLLLAAKIFSHQTMWQTTAPTQHKVAPTRVALARHDKLECVSGQRISALSSQA
jgi:hypothetical protein